MERNEIEEARRKQGMTYQELADKTGISVSTVQRYCRNEVKSPSVDVMKRSMVLLRLTWKKRMFAKSLRKETTGGKLSICWKSGTSRKLNGL